MTALIAGVGFSGSAAGLVVGAATVGAVTGGVAAGGGADTADVFGGVGLPCAVAPGAGTLATTREESTTALLVTVARSGCDAASVERREVSRSGRCAGAGDWGGADLGCGRLATGDGVCVFS